MPELLPWLSAVVAVAAALGPLLWYLVSLIRGQAKELEEVRLDQARMRQELYGVNGDNGLKGRIAVLGERTHDIPTLKQIMLMIEEEHERHQREGK